MENLTGEQQKRIALLEAFEAKTAPEREIRNAGIDQHEQAYREKWLQLQSSMEATRGELHARLKGLNASEQSIAASVAIELAKLTEGYYVEKDKAARELDGTLAKPQSWLDFLKESKLEQPDDPTFDSLIEEAEKAPDPALEGFTKQLAPNIVLADLQAREGKDGVMEYARGLTVAVRDVGDRLDVRKTDDRDIEAALKIAAKKFDVDKGLLLTGDTAFKIRAAEISGKLGYPLQNTEPEVLRAWMRGKQVSQGLERARIPSIDAGITGDPANNLTVAPVGQSVLRADPRTIDVLTKDVMAGVELVGNDKISMPDERMLAANASIKDLGYQAIQQIARVDLEKQDGGVDPDSVGLLQEKGILDADGKLTPLGVDVVMVRDDRILREREAQEPSQGGKIAQYFKTSGDYVREAFLEERESYAGTLLHELGHATGGENRLNRPLSNGFGTSEYAREELVAELCSAFASAETGVQFDDKNHAAYIGSWLEALKGDKHAVFAAAKDASKAVDYLLEKSLAVEVGKDVGLVADEVQIDPVKEEVLKPSKARAKKVANPETELEI